MVLGRVAVEVCGLCAVEGGEVESRDCEKGWRNALLGGGD